MTGGRVCKAGTEETVSPKTQIRETSSLVPVLCSWPMSGLCPMPQPWETIGRDSECSLEHPEVWEAGTKKLSLCPSSSNLLLEAVTMVYSLTGWPRHQGPLELSVQSLEVCLCPSKGLERLWWRGESPLPNRSSLISTCSDCAGLTRPYKSSSPLFTHSLPSSFTVSLLQLCVSGGNRQLCLRG